MRKHLPFEQLPPSGDSEEDKRRTQLRKKLYAVITEYQLAQGFRLHRRDDNSAGQGPENIVYDKLRELVATLLATDELVRDEMIVQLGDEFHQVAERGNPEKIKIFIEEGFPVNWQHPMTGQTALHVVAACQARKALRALLNSGQCDFLIRDKQGRLASEIAYLNGNDPAVARLLGNKERKQAEAKGIKLTRRPSAE